MKLMDIALQTALCACVLVVSSINFLRNCGVFFLSDRSLAFLLIVYV